MNEMRKIKYLSCIIYNLRMADKQPNPIVFLDITIGNTVAILKILNINNKKNLFSNKGSWKNKN
jgi:hypothetical protein